MEKCKDFEVLKSLLLEGANYDLDLSELSQKLEEYITSSSEGLIKSRTFRFLFRWKDYCYCWLTEPIRR